MDVVAQNRARKLLVIEIGAGTAIPTVRYECESTDATVIRINPRDAHGGGNVISVPLGALDALQRIEQPQSGPVHDELWSAADGTSLCRVLGDVWTRK